MLSATAADIEAATRAAELFLSTEPPVPGEVYTEYTFGMDENQLPALKLEGFNVRGKVDRIDVRSDGTSVIHDYKRSDVNSDFAGKGFAKKGKLQLALYWQALNAARAAGATDIPPPVALLYRPLWKGPRSKVDWRPRGAAFDDAADLPAMLSNDVGPAAEVVAWIDEAIDSARDVARRMRAGEVAAAPRDGKLCDTCNLHTICRIGGR
jgi:hypothetical protein